jgi:hypothetical protein
LFVDSTIVKCSLIPLMSPPLHQHRVAPIEVSIVYTEGLLVPVYLNRYKSMPLESLNLLFSVRKKQPLGHVQRQSTSRLQAGIFTDPPPPRASDGRAVVSRKDDGGSCSQALQPSLAPLYARSTANVNPVRRSELGAFAREYGAKKHERSR